MCYQTVLCSTSYITHRPFVSSQSVHKGVHFEDFRKCLKINVMANLCKQTLIFVGNVIIYSFQKMWMLILVQFCPTIVPQSHPLSDVFLSLFSKSFQWKMMREITFKHIFSLYAYNTAREHSALFTLGLRVIDC